MSYIDTPASLALPGPHAWVMLPVDSDVPPAGLAGFDTVEQALAVVAGLSGLETMRAV